MMGRLFTKKPSLLFSKEIKALEPSINTANVSGGFEYSDAYLYDNDARFVFNFIRNSMSYGCIAANYVESQGSAKEGDIWLTKAKDGITGEEITIRSKKHYQCLWSFLLIKMNDTNKEETAHHHVFSKGIHLIVDKITDSEKVLTFFASDGRLFFVIPMGTKTCIGTTDTQVENANAKVTDEDRNFVLDNVNQLFRLS